MAESCSTSMNSENDDDINALFDRVASKLGWLEKQMDLQDCSNASTKRKKTRKCSRKKELTCKENNDPANGNAITEKARLSKSIKKNESKKEKTKQCVITPLQDLSTMNERNFKDEENGNMNMNGIKSSNFSFNHGTTSSTKSSSAKNSLAERSSINYLLDQDLDELYNNSFESSLPNVRISRPKGERFQRSSPIDVATHLKFSCSVSPLAGESPENSQRLLKSDVKSPNSSVEVNQNIEMKNHKSPDINCIEIKNESLEHNLPDSESELDFNTSIKTEYHQQTCKQKGVRSNSPSENLSTDVKFTDSPEPMKWLLSPSSQRERQLENESDDDYASHGVQSLKERLKQNWKTKTAKGKSGNDKNDTKINYRSSSKILDSSSSEDDFESFLASIRTPSRELKSTTIDDDDFINDDLSSSDDEKYFHVRLSQNDEVFAASSTKKKNAGLKKETFKSCDLDDDDYTDDSVFKTPRAFPTSINKQIRKANEIATSSSTTKWQPNSTTSSNFKTRGKTCSGTSSSSVSCSPYSSSFLKSLSTPYKGTSSPSPYVNNFKSTRDDLIKKLFALYNDTVFENKLPSDFKITWNKRMRKTAGFCYYSQNRASKQRYSRIELSDKVCDSAERLRDTLIHELCHAAAWLIHGVSDGHGKFWKYWAAKANVAHPEIPIISRCHSYVINTKFKYDCSKCGYTIGRHSKSLDTSKYRCGCCRGELVLRPQLDSSGKPVKTRAPSKFALYVKENYSAVKKDNQQMKHADIMRVLSQEFSNKAKIMDTC